MLCLIVFIGYLFYQESSKLGRSKKSGGKNGPADDEDVSIFELSTAQRLELPTLIAHKLCIRYYSIYYKSLFVVTGML